MTEPGAALSGEAAASCGLLGLFLVSALQKLIALILSPKRRWIGNSEYAVLISMLKGFAPFHLQRKA
jgi:hypothetical protein